MAGRRGAVLSPLDYLIIHAGKRASKVAAGGDVGWVRETSEAL